MKHLIQSLLRRFGYQLQRVPHPVGNASTSERAPTDDPKAHLVQYTDRSPHPDNSLDLFSGEWSSALPGIQGPGTAPLFDDARMQWLIAQLPHGVNGLQVLELGPLEGGHTFMLEQAGAKVCAIEANYHAFLRCLIIKNYFDLKAQFLLGDFAKDFGSTSRYDLIVASGVLYHMAKPVDLLQAMARSCDAFFIWTHYFEPDLGRWHPEVRKRVGHKWDTKRTQTETVDGLAIRMVPQYYDEALGWAGFCGGPEHYSRWIYREDLLSLIAHLGFKKIQIEFDHPNHPNGPSFCILAQR